MNNIEINVDKLKSLVAELQDHNSCLQYCYDANQTLDFATLVGLTSVWAQLQEMAHAPVVRAQESIVRPRLKMNQSLVERIERLEMTVKKLEIN